MRSPLLLIPLVGILSLSTACKKNDVAKDPRITSPMELADAAKAIGAKRIFVNPGARPFFEKRGISLAGQTAEDAAATRSPGIWRRLDRATRYDAVLLAGRVGEFDALLSHLASSPDFGIVRIDAWGVLFERAAPRPYQSPRPSDVAKAFSSDSDRASYMALMSLMFDGAGQPQAARQFSEAALEKSPVLPIVHIAAAALALHRKDFPTALAHAEKALTLDPENPAALEIAARTLSSAGAADQAWRVAEKLKTVGPQDDPNILFLHARLANTAHAYGAEQASLEKLVALAEERKFPAGNYRVYLGQCYARQGLARPAVQQLELALQDPELSAEQKKDVETAIATVKNRAGRLEP